MAATDFSRAVSSSFSASASAASAIEQRRGRPRLPFDRAQDGVLEDRSRGRRLGSRRQRPGELRPGPGDERLLAQVLAEDERLPEIALRFVEAPIDPRRRAPLTESPRQLPSGPQLAQDPHGVVAVRASLLQPEHPPQRRAHGLVRDRLAERLDGILADRQGLTRQGERVLFVPTG